MIVYRLFYSCTVTTQVKQRCDWREVKGANFSPDKLNKKLSPHFVCISVFGTFLVFSKLLFFSFFGSFWTVIFRWFWVLVYKNPHPNTLSFRFFLRCFRDPIRVPRIENQVPRIRENRVPRIREIGSLQVHMGYLTFSLKKPCFSFLYFFLNVGAPYGG